ncbi:MAG: biotin transporter BioY [Candidatus Omnitrophica bacterium]|nr:biotin transporter BioY [Candidatus Omnitrophota bacterium]
MANANTIYRNNEIITDKRSIYAIGVIFFILATILGAYVRIPVPGSPVPITLQTFFVILSGAVLGRKLGIISMAGYLLFGGAAFFGPTFGYLAGFVLSSYIIGSMLDKKYPVLAAFIAGDAVILALGAAWLVFAFGLDPISSVSVGVLPFIAGDVVKLAAAAIIYNKIAKRTGEIFRSR